MAAKICEFCYLGFICQNTMRFLETSVKPDIGGILTDDHVLDITRQAP